MKIIEVIGLAGAGKSTLANKLIDTLPTSYGCYRLQKMGQINTILYSFIYILPIFINSIFKKNIRNPLRTLLQFEACIKDLRDLKKGNNDGVILLDQGPLYNYVSMSIYELKLDGFDRIKDRYYRNIMEYGRLLDGVIYLNSPIDDLMSRVENRSSDHQIKELNENDTRKFYKEYDVRYSRMIESFELEFNTPVISIDTCKLSIDEVYKKSFEFIQTLKIK